MMTSKPRQRIRLTSPRQPRNPAAQPLRFTPHAWRKLLFLRDLGPTEVGGFGISALDDLLLVEDISLVPQVCTPVSVRFDDEGVADHFDRYVDRGYAAQQIGRIWVHTHPGDSAEPSSTDEETFARCFGSTDWAVMFILARGGATYARLALRGGPGGSILLPVEIDFSRPFSASDEIAWEEDYVLSVSEECFLEPRQDELRERAQTRGPRGIDSSLLDWDLEPFDLSDRLEVASERF